MSEFPFSSAVLLIHGNSGAKPILGSGGLSGGVIHRIEYDGRLGQWEERGGVDRDLTHDDRNNVINTALERKLSYDSRTNEFSEKGRDRQVDATFFGQAGPLTREEIETDMMMSGGCYLESIISVERLWAGECEITSKQDFERLMRANWQNMMALSLNCDPSNIHWYACYHTDANMSLHVHIATWSANGMLSEIGWHPSANSTRDQKRILYRDAYRVPRREMEREESLYRARMHVIAKRELDIEVPKSKLNELSRNARRCGIENVPIEKTLDARGTEAVKKRLDNIKKEIERGSGRVDTNWKLRGQALDLVDDLRKHSKQFADTYNNFMKCVEKQADINGRAVTIPDKNLFLELTQSKAAYENQINAAEITKHERKDFIDKQKDDIRWRVASQLVRSMLPEKKDADIKREIADIKRGLLNKALDTRNNPLRLSKDVQDALRGAIQSNLGVTRSKLPESYYKVVEQAARAIVASPYVGSRIEHLREKLNEKGNREDPRDLLRVALIKETSRRTEQKIIQPYGREATIMARGIIKENSRGLFNDAFATRGASLGLTKEAWDRAEKNYSDAKVYMSRGDKAEAERCISAVVSVLRTSTKFTRSVDKALNEAAAVYGKANIPKRERVENSLEIKLAKQIEGRIDRELHPSERNTRGISMGDLGLGLLAARAVRELIQERPDASEYKRDRKHRRGSGRHR